MRLERAFFARPVLEVAPELLGLLLVRELGSGARLVGRIVEVEAYVGGGRDAASHAHRGRTPRNAVMFGPPGHFYVYLSMGIHACLNVVCEPEGSAAAVLLRALEPLEGVEHMAKLRRGAAERELTSGPGKLAQALAIGLELNGSDALSGALRLERPRGARTATSISAGPRIGISKAAELPYRYFVRESRFVTRSPLNRRAVPLARALDAGTPR
jgi:DNA-3-methyladenine glycosylase